MLSIALNHITLVIMIIKIANGIKTIGLAGLAHPEK
jgi:hypothetical protein